MNTKFSYMYRDGANYKDYYEIVLDGVLSAGEIDSILVCCDGEFFLPRAIGLPGGLLETDPGYDAAYDHYWCEHYFEDSFELVDAEPSKVLVRGQKTTIAAAEFCELFSRCKDFRWENVLSKPISVLDIRNEKKASLSFQLSEASKTANCDNDDNFQDRASSVIER